EITFILLGNEWKGTVALKPTNPPYVHTRLTSSSLSQTCTEIFIEMNLGNKAQLLFEVVRRGVFRLERVLYRGELRSANYSDVDSTSKKTIARRSSHMKVNSLTGFSGDEHFPFDNRDSVLCL